MIDRTIVGFLFATLAALVGCSDGAATSTADAAVVDAPSADAGIVSAHDASLDVGADAPSPNVTCSAYCTLVASNCAGASAQFATSEQCPALCADIPLGVFGDSDDSVGCREAHAMAASTNPAANCAAAGPFGGGACGDRCDDYCSVMLSLCNGPDAPYNNKTICWNDGLQHFPFDANAAEYADTGNTLNCREHYLELVGTADAGDRTMMCAAAGPQSTPCH